MSAAPLLPAPARGPVTFGADVRKHIEIPMETIDTLLEMAGFGLVGMALTCDWDRGALQYTVTWEEDEGDPETRTSRTVVYQQLANTLARVYSGELECGDDTRRAVRIELDDPDSEGAEFDAVDGEQIVQLALFGEIRWA